MRNKPTDREHFAMVLTFLIDREHYNLEGAVHFLLKYNITNNQYSTGTIIEKFGYYNPLKRQQVASFMKRIDTWFLEESRGMTISDYLLDASSYGLLTVSSQQQIGDDYYFVYSEKHAKAVLKQYFNIDLQPSQLKTGLSKDHDVEMNIFYKNGYYYVPGYEFPGSILWVCPSSY